MWGKCPGGKVYVCVGTVTLLFDIFYSIVRLEEPLT